MPLSSTTLLAYHGCDQSVADDIIAKRQTIHLSTNSYDWLGGGAYFWVGSYHRALDWAEGLQKRGKISNPAVLCAEVEPKNCLNLTELGMSAELLASFDDLKLQLQSTGGTLPQNGGPVRFGIPMYRNLDCAVIEHLHQQRNKKGYAPYDTVLGAFEEGQPAFSGAQIRQLSHIQLAVRSPDCIRTVFQLPPAGTGK